MSKYNISMPADAPKWHYVQDEDATNGNQRWHLQIDGPAGSMSFDPVECTEEEIAAARDAKNLNVFGRA
jgi:hypothetical protein